MHGDTTRAVSRSLYPHHNTPKYLDVPHFSARASSSSADPVSSCPGGAAAGTLADPKQTTEQRERDILTGAPRRRRSIVYLVLRSLFSAFERTANYDDYDDSTMVALAALANLAVAAAVAAMAVAAHKYSTIRRNILWPPLKRGLWRTQRTRDTRGLSRIRVKNTLKTVDVVLE